MIGVGTPSVPAPMLREAGVVRQRYAGTARLNTLRLDDLDAAFPGLLAAVLPAAARRT
jgi:hypothetical protein